MAKEFDYWHDDYEIAELYDGMFPRLYWHGLLCEDRYDIALTLSLCAAILSKK